MYELVCVCVNWFVWMDAKDFLLSFFGDIISLFASAEVAAGELSSTLGPSN